MKEGGVDVRAGEADAARSPGAQEPAALPVRRGRQVRRGRLGTRPGALGLVALWCALFSAHHNGSNGVLGAEERKPNQLRPQPRELSFQGVQWSHASSIMKAELSQGARASTSTGCAREDGAEFAASATAGDGDSASRRLRGGSGHPLRGGGLDGELDGHCGRIEMIVGPMFAGKSTELMRRIRRHKLAYRRCVVIKYAKDQRHGEPETELSTHDNNRIKALPCTQLYDAWNEARESDVIGIDEAQFYPDLIKFCEEMADAGKIIILAALDGDFQRNPFGAVLQLAPRAESMTKLSAVCRVCGREASFTRRTTDNTETEAIGGAEMYMPTCRKCFRCALPAESPQLPEQ